MKKIDPVVLKETYFICLFTLILSVLMQAVYLIIGHWSVSALLGNILGALAAALNFFLMGLTVQSALGMEQKDAQNKMKLSQRMRMLMLFAVALIGYLVPIFDIFAVIIPFIFPRIAVALRPMFMKKEDKE